MYLVFLFYNALTQKYTLASSQQQSLVKLTSKVRAFLVFIYKSLELIPVGALFTHLPERTTLFVKQFPGCVKFDYFPVSENYDSVVINNCF